MGRFDGENEINKIQGARRKAQDARARRRKERKSESVSLSESESRNNGLSEFFSNRGSYPPHTPTIQSDFVAQAAYSFSCPIPFSFTFTLMYLLLKWLILGWSLVVVLLWGFLSFRQWQSGEVLFASQEDLMGFMILVFLTWFVPIAIFAFFAFLARPKKP